MWRDSRKSYLNLEFPIDVESDAGWALGSMMGWLVGLCVCDYLSWKRVCLWDASGSPRRHRCGLDRKGRWGYSRVTWSMAVVSCTLGTEVGWLDAARWDDTRATVRLVGAGSWWWVLCGAEDVGAGRTVKWAMPNTHQCLEYTCEWRTTVFAMAWRLVSANVSHLLE